MTKAMELAKYLLAQGRHMSARDIFESGFRFECGYTTADSIGAILNKLHESSQFTVQRHLKQDGRVRSRIYVAVTDIKERRSSPNRSYDSLPLQQAETWRWLLSRRRSV